MKAIYVTYVLGVALIAAVGFLSPIWYLGFAPLGVGALWATYDLIEAEDTSGDTPRPPQ